MYIFHTLIYSSASLLKCLKILFNKCFLRKGKKVESKEEDKETYINIYVAKRGGKKLYNLFNFIFTTKVKQSTY